MIGFGPIESRSNGYFIRCHHVAKSLSKLNHDVLIMEFSKEKSLHVVKSEEGMKIVHLRMNEIGRNRVLRTLKGVLTFDLLYSIKFQLHSLIELTLFRNYIKDCDLVFVEGALIPLGIILPKVLRKKVVLDTHCINKLLALHYKNRNLLIYFARKTLWDLLERFATRVSDWVIVVSEKENDYVQREYAISRSKMIVIPHVVYMPRRKYATEKINQLREKWRFENKIVVAFVGDLESVQNRDAVEYIVNELAPFFWRKRSDVVFLVIGKGKEDFRSDCPNVIFTGFVEDLASLLELSDVCIAPLRVGAGVKTKVLTYMVHGKPVITTRIGVEGIVVDKSKSVIVTDAVHFAETLLEALNTLGELKGKARGNRLIARNMYSPDHAAELELKRVLKCAETLR